MSSYKEIVTKAVIGKGKKSFNDVYTITPEIAPTTVLGCWVIIILKVTLIQVK